MQLNTLTDFYDQLHERYCAAGKLTHSGDRRVIVLFESPRVHFVNVVLIKFRHIRVFLYRNRHERQKTSMARKQGIAHTCLHLKHTV